MGKYHSKWNNKTGKWEDDEDFPYNYGGFNYGNRYYGRVVTQDEMWDSGWVTHEKPKLFVSQAIVGVCNSIQARFPGLEWAILLKGEWTKFGFEISNNYAVPKQTVSAATVKFDDADVERFKVEGYNVVLHSHHNMGISFSGSDHDTLTDSSFAASLLYSKGTIKEATISITVKEGVRVALSPAIEVIGFLTEIPDEIDKVITKTEHKYHYGDNRKDTKTTEEDKKTDSLKNEDNVLVRAEDGTLSDTYGIPYYGTEEHAKSEGYEIISEEEDFKRFCKESGCRKIDQLDYNFG